jgi:integrase
VQWLLGHTAGEDDRAVWGHALWDFLANTGLRIGEALALRWANVDLDGGWFLVAEDLERDRRPGDPKTDASLREVPMTAAALAALRAPKRAAAERLQAALYPDPPAIPARSPATPGAPSLPA